MVFEGLKRRFGFASEAKQVPQETRSRLQLDDDVPIYAIGDIHGQLDLLLEMEAVIAADAIELGCALRVVLLGDLIDRGPASAGVLDYFLGKARSVTPWVYLLGNHEDQFLEFLADPSPHGVWLQHGGLETLLSYGVDATQLTHRRDLERAIKASIPEEHLALLRALPIAAENADFFLCHAGVVPGRPLSEQDDNDLVWYRDKMRADFQEFGKTIVHGHQIVPEPVLTKFRINVDIGAYATGRLAAVRLSKTLGVKIFITGHRGRRASLG
jgi:serine/threonine protein phosphatase 1